MTMMMGFTVDTVAFYLYCYSYTAIFMRLRVLASSCRGLCWRRFGTARGGAITAGLDVILEILEGGAHVAGNGPASKFDGYGWWRAPHESRHGDAQDVVVGMFPGGALAHVRGERSDQSIAQQDAQEGAYQSRRYLFSNFFRWAA